MKLDLIRDLLDKQLIDKDETKMGRVDGLVIEVRDGEPPVVDHFQLGFTVLARRLHPRAEQFVRWLRRHWQVRKTEVQIVRWPLVAEIAPPHIKVSINAQESPAFDWEKFLREKIVEKLPGSIK